MPHEKTEHKFTHPELNYCSEPNFQPCPRVSVFFNKNERIDYDTLYGHWQTVHADLAVATEAFGDGIFRYTQHHHTPETKERVRSLDEKMLGYDGCATLWVKDWDSWLRFKNSEGNAAALGPDCEYFMALPLIYMVGYEKLVVGDASRYIGGKDGLKPKASTS